MTFRIFGIAFAASLTLSGCSPSTNAVIQSLQYAVTSTAPVAKPLNPAYQYLRVTIDGRVALLVLGYVDSHPQGPIQVWYSGEREVIKLQNGRIVGATGLTTEWRNVKAHDLPPWAASQGDGQVSRWSRVRDVMPGYHFGVHDQLTLKSIPPPIRTELQELNPNELSWFEESMVSEALSSGVSAKTDLPPAIYAIASKEGVPSVVYAEQCLAPKLCFAWQRWPAVSQIPKRP